LPERVPASYIAILAVLIILALPVIALPAAPEIFLQEEPQTYLVIEKLEGMCFLPGLMTGDRGLEARDPVGKGLCFFGAGDFLTTKGVPGGPSWCRRSWSSHASRRTSKDITQILYQITVTAGVLIVAF
jgi:hypothetical protein